MTIAGLRDKCKELLRGIPQDVLVVLMVVLASFLSFGLGYLSGLDAGKTAEIVVSDAIPDTTLEGATSKVGEVVASKSGTKYYLPNCAGASRIAEANKIRFASAALARQAGYTPAANCPGI